MVSRETVELFALAPSPGIKEAKEKYPSALELHSTLVRRAFPGGSDDKESACNVGDLGSIPGLGRCPGERNGNPLQYSGLENPMEDLAGYSPWGGKESDTTEQLQLVRRKGDSHNSWWCVFMQTAVTRTKVLNFQFNS